MGKVMLLPKKLRLIAARKRKSAPRWADLKKFGRRARTRRIRVARTKHWRRGRLKV
ncbi:MAG: 50S ribosomal protein L39e [Candidatus Aenigmatarchaeota archaeon]|nr:50S ribosomal protein L39e [Candidatus Aenigmarchaeota archaeon]